MKYISTRNKFNEVDIYDAIIKGLSDDGGLYIPKEFKQVNIMKLIEKSNTIVKKTTIKNNFITKNNSKYEWKLFYKFYFDKK